MSADGHPVGDMRCEVCEQQPSTRTILHTCIVHTPCDKNDLAIRVCGMPARTTGERQPNRHVTHGTWPTATLDGTPAALYAQHVARNLKAAIGDRSHREIARTTGLSDVTIAAVLAGTNYPDLRTLARLETALNTRLLPDWPARAR